MMLTIMFLITHGVRIFTQFQMSLSQCNCIIGASVWNTSYHKITDSLQTGYTYTERVSKASHCTVTINTYFTIEKTLVAITTFHFQSSYLFG